MTEQRETQFHSTTLIAALLLLGAVIVTVCIPWRLARLIDVGVRCSGVEYATPLRIRASTMDDLQLFLPKDAANEAKRAYELVDGVYLLHGDAARRLNDVFTLPVLQYLRLSQQGVNTFPAIHAAMESGAMTREDVIKRANALVDEMGTLTPRARIEAAASFVRTEYAVSGGDLDALRKSVITTELWHMALLAAAAVLAAGIGFALLERGGTRLSRALFPAGLAVAATVCGVICSLPVGLILAAEAIALLFALWRLSARSRRAVSLAACAIAIAFIPGAASSDAIVLQLSPGQLVALLAWAMLSAAPGLCARSGKEARA